MSAQEGYPFKFFNREFDYILEYSANLSTEDDFYWRAKVLKEQKKTQEAISLLENSINTYDQNKQIKLLLADYYYETYQYSRAFSLYQTNLEDINVFIKTINILDFLGQNKKCVELVEERIAKDSNNIELYQMLGDNYLKLDSINQAINYYQKILLLNPDNQKYAYKLALLFNKAKKFDNALAISDSVITKDSTCFNFIKIKGIALFSKQEYVQASFCFMKLLYSGDSSIFNLKHYGICKYKLNELSESKYFLQKAYLKNPTDSEITYFLSKCYETSAEMDSGLFFLNKTELLLMPDSSSMYAIYVDKAIYYDALTIYDMAVNCFKIAYSYNEVNSLLFNIASIYQYKLNKKELALKYYESFIENIGDVEKSTLFDLAKERLTFLKEELFFEGKL